MESAVESVVVSSGVFDPWVGLAVSRKHPARFTSKTTDNITGSNLFICAFSCSFFILGILYHRIMPSATIPATFVVGILDKSGSQVVKWTKLHSAVNGKSNGDPIIRELGSLAGSPG
jgi:hypothetical protein